MWWRLESSIPRSCPEIVTVPGGLGPERNRLQRGTGLREQDVLRVDTRFDDHRAAGQDSTSCGPDRAERLAHRSLPRVQAGQVRLVHVERSTPAVAASRRVVEATGGAGQRAADATVGQAVASTQVRVVTFLDAVPDRVAAERAIGLVEVRAVGEAAEIAGVEAARIAGLATERAPVADLAAASLEYVVAAGAVAGVEGAICFAFQAVAETAAQPEIGTGGAVQVGAVTLLAHFCNAVAAGRAPGAARDIERAGRRTTQIASGAAEVAAAGAGEIPRVAFLAAFQEAIAADRELVGPAVVVGPRSRTGIGRRRSVDPGRAVEVGVPRAGNSGVCRVNRGGCGRQPKIA